MTQRGQATTISDQALEIFRNIVGTMVPGAENIPGVDSFILSGLQRLTGTAGDPIFEGILTAPSNRAAVDRLYASRGSAAGARLSAAFATQANAKVARDIYGMLYSKSSFEQMQAERPELQGITYDEFLDTRSAPGAVPSFLLKALDPLKIGGMAPEMTRMVSALSSRGRYLQGRGTGAIADAVELTKSVFFDEDGKAEFKRSDYSGYYGKDIAKLAADIASTESLIGTGDSGNTENLRRAGERLRNRLKEYADALAPLQQFFGYDMKSTVELVESVTGKKVGSLGARVLKHATEMLAARLETGTYSEKELQGIGTFIGAAQKGMRIRPFDRGSRALHATRTADALSGEYSLGLYDRTEEKELISMSMVQQRSAEMVGVLNKAYALWDQRVGDKNANLSTAERAERFRKGVLRRMSSGMTHDQAAMAMAGVRNVAELGAAGGLEAYADIIHSGNMADLNQEIYLRSSATAAKNLAMSNTGVQRYLDRAGIRSRKGRERQTTLVVDALVENPDLLKRIYEGAPGSELEKIIGTMPQRFGGVDQGVLRMTAMAIMEDTPELAHDMMLNKSLRDSRKRDARIRTEKEFSEKYRQGEVARSLQDYVEAMLGSGGDITVLRDKMFSATKELAHIDPNRAAQLKAVAEFAKSYSDGLRLPMMVLPEENRLRYAKDFSQTIDWAIAGAGLESVEVQNALDTITRSNAIAGDQSARRDRRSGAQAEARRAFNVIHAEKTYGKGAYRSFVDAQAARLAAENPGMKKDTAAELAENTIQREIALDIVKYTPLGSKRLAGDKLATAVHGEGTATKRIIEAFRSSANMSYEDMASIKWGELAKHMDKFKESYTGRHRAQVDQAMEFLQTSIKRVSQETGREVGAPAGKGTSDIWNILDKRFPELINVLRDFINQISNIPLPTASKVGTTSGA
jgi:gas vesicle protein